MEFQGRLAVYFWAGQATIDLLREKLPDLPIDEASLLAGCTPEAASELARLGADWVFLASSWGFPPEIERRHWQEFDRALEVFHAAGLKVLAYVQASNCVATGSYAQRDWYALTPSGRRVPYYRRRLMTCWNHLGWLGEVEDRALRAVDAGADGVYFDNLWMGVTPWVLGGRVGGFAGCACARCQAACRAGTGRTIPRVLADDQATTEYLGWRARVVTRRLEAWVRAVTERRGDALVLANNCDVVLRDTRTLLGLDLGGVGRLQDALLVENVAMAGLDDDRLVANALVIKAVNALVPGRPVLPLAYWRGIGLDGPPPPHRIRRSVAEALACGAVPTLKGTEYLDTRGRMSVVTAPDFAPLRAAVAALLRFAALHDTLLRGGAPDPEVGVYLDGEGSPADRFEAVAAAFAVALILIEGAVPFCFVTDASLAEGHAAPPTLIVPPGTRPPAGDLPAAQNLLALREGDLDVPARPAGAFATAFFRSVLDHPLRGLSRLYFGSPRVRRAFDRSGLTASFLASPLFRRSRDGRRLLDRLPPLRGPRITASRPVLVERWRLADGSTSLRLVNYADDMATLAIEGFAESSAEVCSPDAGTSWRAADGRLEVALECLAVVSGRPTDRRDQP